MNVKSSGCGAFDALPAVSSKLTGHPLLQLPATSYAEDNDGHVFFEEAAWVCRAVVRDR